MNWLNSIDIFLFRLINDNGFIEMDKTMLFVSDKLTWIPLYILLLYLLFKKYNANFIWIIISLCLLVFLADYGSVHIFKDGFESGSPYDVIFIDAPINKISEKILNQLNKSQGKLIMIEKENNNLSKAIKITKNENNYSKEYLFDVFSKYELFSEKKGFKF